MRTSRIGRTAALISTIAALAAALALPAVSAAAKALPKPRISTGAATHVLGTSALLTGHGHSQRHRSGVLLPLGPTIAYGSQTPTLPVNLGTTPKVKVGQPIAGLSPGITYHFRAFAVNAAGVVVAEGRDKIFKAKGNALAFNVQKSPGRDLREPVRPQRSPHRTRRRQPQDRAPGEPVPLPGTVRHDRRPRRHERGGQLLLPRRRTSRRTRSSA